MILLYHKKVEIDSGSLNSAYFYDLTSVSSFLIMSKDWGIQRIIVCKQFGGSDEAVNPC